MINYTLDKTNLKILDSYKIRKCKIRKILSEIKKKVEDEGIDTDVFKRTIFSLKMEMICHNFLYNVGYERDRTKDTDLDNPSDHPEWLYIICGLLVWIFVW